MNTRPAGCRSGRLATGASKIFRCLSVVVASSLHSTGYAQNAQPYQALRPLQVADLLATREFVLGSTVTLSRDGRWVAYAIGESKIRSEPKYLVYDSTGAPSQVGHSTLFVADTRTGQSVTVSTGETANWEPAWSPDGRFLAFCSARDGMARLWIWERRTGTLRRAADVVVLVPTRWPQPPRWMPDSRHVLVKILPNGLTVNQLIGEAARVDIRSNEDPVTGQAIAGASVTPYVSPSYSGEAARPAVDTNAIQRDYRAKVDRGDLAIIDVVTGSLRRLTQQTHPSWYLPSPDGLTVAFAEHRGLRGGNNWRRSMDLYAIALRDSIPKLLVPQLQQETGRVSWSPDGRWLAYTQLGEDADGDLHIVSAAGGASENISRGGHPSFSTELHDFGVARAPLWNRDGTTIYMIAADTLWAVPLAVKRARAVAAVPDYELLEALTVRDGSYWSPDGGQSMYVKIRNIETKAMGYAQIQVGSGHVLRRFTESKSYGAFEWSQLGQPASAGTEFVYVAEDVGHPPDIWLSDTSLGQPRQVTHLNPHLDSYTMGVSQVIAWRGLDGQELRGALLLPSNFQRGRTYPLIVKIFGGESSGSAVHQFGLTPSHHLENMQLLATRGYAALVPDAPQGIVTPMADLAKAILPGVNKAIEMGIADPDRLGVMGHSYGGYSTLSLLVQTQRFRAAISSAAPANWFTLYGELSPTGDAWGIGVTEDGQGLMRSTPWERRDKYIENSPYFYLDRVQTPLLLMQGTADEGVYPNNSDEIFVGLRRLGKSAVYLKYKDEGHFLSKYENRLDYLNRAIAWFETYLKPESSAGLTRHDTLLSR